MIIPVTEAEIDIVPSSSVRKSVCMCICMYQLCSSAVGNCAIQALLLQRVVNVNNNTICTCSGMLSRSQWRRNRGFRRFNEPWLRAAGAQSSGATKNLGKKITGLLRKN